VFVTGHTSSAAGIVDYATVGYDASTGTRLWASRYNGAGRSGSRANSLAVSPGGGMV
jgi:hypothetical protein